MDKNNYIVAIDLGSSHIAVAAAGKDPDGKLNIIDAVIEPMEGMVMSEVTNIEQVTVSAKKAISRLEESLGAKITGAYAGISGRDIKCADSSYFVYVSGEDGEIREEDVAKLHESMNTLQPPDGVCILDRTPQRYVIDFQEETMYPVGRFGNRLEAMFNFTLGNKSSVDRLGKAFSRLGINDFVLCANARASAAAVLTADEKELGAAVIDIGAHCTDICIWQDNIMRYVSVLPIGSDAINRDIRSIAIPDRFIEKLKVSHGYAMANHIPDEKKGQSIKIKGRTPREDKEISFVNLAQIIEARMMDIVEHIMDEIKDSGYADKLGAGIVLTGGGAMLQEIETLFREKTKYDVRIGAAESGLLNESSREIAEDLRLTTVIGLLLTGMAESGIEASDITAGRRNTEPKKGNDSDGADDTDTHDNDEKPEKQPKEKKKKKKEKPEKQPKEAKKGGFFGSIGSIFTDIFEVVDDDEIS